jgi:hypothetical protein
VTLPQPLCPGCHQLLEQREDEVFDGQWWPVSHQAVCLPLQQRLGDYLEWLLNPGTPQPGSPAP